MTKSNMEEFLELMGYKLTRRMGGDYWHKDNSHAVKVEQNRAIVFSYNDGQEIDEYYLNDDWPDGGYSE